MFSFGELKDKVAALAQRSEAAYKTKIGVWLQLSHKLLYEVYDYWIELQDIYSFNTADGTQTYPMPNNFDKPLRIFDTTNDKEMEIENYPDYFAAHQAAINDSDTDKPNTAMLYGSTGVRVPISTSGDTTKVKSSSASDTAGVKVRIRGYVDSANLIEDFEDITISATSPTSYVAGTKTFYRITHISKSDNTTGYVTIVNSSNATLETLAPNDRVARHKILRLGPIPDNTYAMKILFKRMPSEMVSDYDYPFTECDRYLIMDGFGWALKQDNKDQQAEYAWKQAENALSTLLANQNNKLGPAYQHKITSNWLAAHRRW